MKMMTNIIYVILFLMVAVISFMAVSPPEIFHHHFYSGKAFSFIELVSDLWPEQILIVTTFMSAMVFVALFHRQIGKVINSININGNILIPMLYLLPGIFVFSVCVLDINHARSVPVLSKSFEEIDRDFWRFYYLCVGAFIYLSCLYHSNESLPKPAHPIVFAALFVFTLAGLDAGATYAFTGEINYLIFFEHIIE